MPGPVLGAESPPVKEMRTLFILHRSPRVLPRVVVFKAEGTHIKSIFEKANLVCGS